MSEATYEVVIDDSIDVEALKRVLAEKFPDCYFNVRKIEKTALEREIANQVRNKLLFGP